ncbi:MAG: Sir2 family NAD-dependent protein deacetylase [Campylobacterota bacterium]|nr:Sir2 family NAD-dependent protein deacetylase [Campylobacterota bacterium]
MHIKELQQLIKDSDAVLITAGAGMGVDSGLPDFRGNEGFWKAYPPIAKLGLKFHEMANPKWFDDNPTLAWAFYGHRLNLYKDTIPHDGFKMLLNLAKEKNDNYFIFTSNVDGQFQKAGFDENNIYEVHGSIHHLQCSNGCSKDLWINEQYIKIDMDKFEAIDIPLCPKCGAVARPNILMFGDWGFNSKRANRQEQGYMKWRKQNRLKKIVIIEIGAGTQIPTVRFEGEQIVKHYDATLIRINPREFEVDTKRGLSVPLGGLEGIKSILQDTT